jgi:hypothetical protein
MNEYQTNKDLYISGSKKAESSSLLSHKYERHGLCVAVKDRIPAADGLRKMPPIHISRYYLRDISSEDGPALANNLNEGKIQLKN